MVAPGGSAALRCLVSEDEGLYGLVKARPHFVLVTTFVTATGTAGRSEGSPRAQGTTRQHEATDAATARQE